MAAVPLGSAFHWLSRSISLLRKRTFPALFVPPLAGGFVGAAVGATDGRGACVVPGVGVITGVGATVGAAVGAAGADVTTGALVGAVVGAEDDPVLNCTVRVGGSDPRSLEA